MELEQIDASKLREAASAARTAKDGEQPCDGRGAGPGSELLTDAVQDYQPGEPPELDATLVGHKLGMRWRCGARKRLIVVRVADGKSDMHSERARTLLPAGASYVKWPVHEERNEPESHA
eukprot:2345471-Pleurochrysis_carterae.AAC.1